jgi:hypothetical protein
MMQRSILCVALTLILSTTNIFAANVRNSAEPENAEAVKIVLEQQTEHVKLENYYIKQVDLAQDRLEEKEQELRKEIIQKAERKGVLATSIQIATCYKVHDNADDRKECVDDIRQKFLGPKPVFGVAPAPEKMLDKETIVKTDDPKLLKRVLQIYASKRESLNLLKSELNLVQGLARLLTGEALDDELEVKIESAALLENSKRQSREMSSKVSNSYKLIKISMKPEIIAPRPPHATKPVARGPTPWEIYSAKLQHAAYNGTDGLGPNQWNPTRGDRMMHEDEEIDERDENYHTDHN